MLETWVWSLGREDPLEKGMAPHSNILAWRISGTEEPGRLPSLGLQRVGHDWATNSVKSAWNRWGWRWLGRVLTSGPPLFYSELKTWCLVAQRPSASGQTTRLWADGLAVTEARGSPHRRMVRPVSPVTKWGHGTGDLTATHRERPPCVQPRLYTF